MLLHQRKRSEKSLSDEWALPELDFNRISRELEIYPIIDVCATESNTKCIFYMDKEIDSLKTDWLIENSHSKPNRPPYCDSLYAPRYINPPNKYTQLFIEKADQQNKKFNFVIIMVIPINATVTKNGLKFIWNNPDVLIRPVYPTPKFIYDGKQEQQARNRYCVVTWLSINRVD